MKQPEQIEHVHFVDNSHGWAWGGGRNDEHAVQPGIFLVTVDGGQSWTSVSFPFDQNSSELFFLDSLHGWASTEGASFYRTNDGGLNWTKAETKLPEDVFRSIFFTDSNNGWVVGRSGRLAKTTDSGRTWKKMYQTGSKARLGGGRSWSDSVHAGCGRVLVQRPGALSGEAHRRRIRRRADRMGGGPERGAAEAGTSMIVSPDYPVGHPCSGAGALTKMRRQMGLQAGASQPF
jgi:hypothetical protein